MTAHKKQNVRLVWQQAYERTTRSEQLLESQPAARLGGELPTARLWSLHSCFWLGRIAELQQRVPSLMQLARERNDLFERVSLGGFLFAVLRLAQDDPRAARRAVDEAMNDWTGTGSDTQHRFNIQHHFNVMGRTAILFYENEQAAALRLLNESRGAYKRFALWRCQLVRAEFRRFEVLAILAQVAGSHHPRELLRAARRQIKLLQRENAPWIGTLTLLFLGKWAALRGDSDAAIRDLTRAMNGFEAAGMALHGNIALRELGLVSGGQDGHEMISRADAWMTQQNIRSPERFALLS